MKKFTSITMAILLIISMFSFSAIAAEKRRESKTRTVAKIGLGTALGAGVGALIGGGRGATAGALIGGGAMTAHSLARRDSGQGRKTRMISTIAAGSLVGTGLGAAIGGKKGAGVGALIGGGSSTIYALTRKDLKEPKSSPQRLNLSNDSYRSSPGNLNAQQQSPRLNFSNSNVASNSLVNINDDPYQRLSGSQGALVGNLLANGSRAFVKPASVY